MTRPILALCALAALALAALPAPTAAASDPLAAGKCYEYMYVADYHWYYVCVEPKGGLCAVYFQERHGVTYTPKDCLVDAPATAAPGPTCVPTSGGLDYHSFLCVDAGDRGCPVYTLASSDAGVVKTCIPR
jgi:hypothetical protein